jgi:hypothetical protein
MHERVADVLIRLAEDGALENVVLDALNDDERAAILSGDDAKVFALFSRERAAAPAVAKIWTGVDEDTETPAVAKIWTGVDEDETPAVAKIWTGVDEEAQPLRKCA